MFIDTGPVRCGCWSDLNPTRRVNGNKDQGGDRKTHGKCSQNKWLGAPLLALRHGHYEVRRLGPRALVPFEIGQQSRGLE